MSLRRYAEDVCNDKKAVRLWAAFLLVLPKGPFWRLYPKVILIPQAAVTTGKAGPNRFLMPCHTLAGRYLSTCHFPQSTRSFTMKPSFRKMAP